MVWSCGGGIARSVTRGRRTAELEFGRLVLLQEFFGEVSLDNANQNSVRRGARFGGQLMCQFIPPRKGIG